MTLFPDSQALEDMLQDRSALSIYRVLFHRKPPNNAAAIAHIRTRIIHGRYATICPPISAWELHKSLPSSELILVADGAHSPVDGGMTGELVKAADEFRDRGL